jgi:phage gp36-like protein
MTYASQQNLIDRFGADELIELTDRDGLDVIDATVIDRALADADAEINGYLASKYTLPLSTVPQILQAYTCDIARYRLHDENPKEIVVERYKDAIRYLKDVVSGKASLGIDDGSGEPIANNSVQMSSTPPVWRRENSRDFI